MSRGALPRIALLALIWGSAFLWIKLADRGFSPVEVTLARLIFSPWRTASELVSALTLAGMALVLAGVALTRRRGYRRDS